MPLDSTDQHDLPTEALDYSLPEELIAIRPASPRDSARMLVVRRSGADLEHRSVSDLPEFLQSGDLLVMNDTWVLPARFFGLKHGSGGRVEGLFVEEESDGTWRVMLKSNGRLRPGIRLDLLDSNDVPSDWSLELVAKPDDEWVVRPDPHQPAAQVLAAIGMTPLPPYIRRARRTRGVDDPHDRDWYQTTFADPAHRESVAAPTAGLHFTPELLGRIDAVGVRREMVTLHVGPGTFRPIEAETLGGHDMHRERFTVGPETLSALRSTCSDARKDQAGRCIAVGTTTVRTLESLPDPLPPGADQAINGSTDLLIAPPYEFRHVDGLLTNFHLPRSTLLALVAALVGLERLKEIYGIAIEERYRFYSYGDAMLILP